VTARRLSRATFHNARFSMLLIALASARRTGKLPQSAGMS
jgi:hypothetical protein